MPILGSLQKARTLSELAELLGYKTRSLSYILYKIPDSSKYTSFQIGKKNGGVREIKAPIDRVKQLQKRLATLLTNCDSKISKTLNHKDSLSHGFKKGHSIITNADKHKNKRYVFNIDLEDFFPSINFGRVRGFFIKNSHFKLEPKIATIIAQIACHDNTLPQGSPCSPIISNLIGHILDIRMVNLAKKTKCTYSRYVDDLTFSTNQKEFPAEIAIKKNDSENVWIAGCKLEKEVSRVGFKINENKTSLQFKTSRQIATGLVVNEKINVRREYYKIARSMCNSLFHKDLFHVNKINDEAGGASSEQGSMNQLEGILSYIYQIRLENEKLKDKSKNTAYHKSEAKHFNTDSSVAKLYKKLLFYKHLFSLEKPLVICEGKTDSICLQCALKQLFDKNRGLIEKNTDGYTFHIDFLRKSNTILNILFFADGTSGLVSLMKGYTNEIKAFTGNGKKYPVIIFADNDKGAEKIKEKIKEKQKVGEFISRYTDNLYVALIPHVHAGDKETAIEDLFYEETLAIKIKDKIFNPNYNFDHKTEYSKIVFAKQVVKANQNTINFNRFQKVFDLFDEIIQDYKTNK